MEGYIHPAIEIKFETKQKKVKERIIQRFKKNLKFFKKNLPEFYDDILGYSDKKKVILRVFDNDYDLIFNKSSIYPKGARNYKILYERIENVIDIFNDIKSIPWEIHKKVVINPLLKWQKYLKKENLDKNVFGIFCLFGLGLGLYLEDFIKNNEIKELVIFEDEYPIFIASLYTIDWEKIYKLQRRKGNLKLVIKKIDTEDAYGLFTDLLHLIFEKNLYLAYVTGIGIHYKHPTFFEKIKEILDKVFSYVRGLGFYDDEKIALENALGLFERKYKYLKIREARKKDTLVAFVGSGPSLKDNIEKIKKIQDKAIIVSCGTSLKSLYAYNIKPDIWLNMERTPSVEDIVKDLPNEYLSDILCFTTDNTYPKVTDYFKKENVFLYPRGGSVPAYILNPICGLVAVSPTVINAAFNLFYKLGFRNFALFGVDLGTKDTDIFHDENTIYSKEEDKEKIKNPIKIEGNFGGYVYTNGILMWTKIMLERFIEIYKVKVFNFSDGARIKGALPSKDVDILKSYYTEKKSQVITNLKRAFSNDYKKLFSPQNFEHILNETIKFFSALNACFLLSLNDYKYLKEYLQNITKSLFNVVIQLENPALKSFMIGSISTAISLMYWTFFFIPKNKRKKYLIDITKEYSLEFSELQNIFINNEIPKIKKLIDMVKNKN